MKKIIVGITVILLTVTVSFVSPQAVLSAKGPFDSGGLLIVAKVGPLEGSGLI